MEVKKWSKERERTRSAFFACSTASQGAGRSRNTVPDMRGVEGGIRWERTSVHLIDNCEPVFTYVPMSEGDEVVHPVAGKFIPGE